MKILLRSIGAPRSGRYRWLVPSAAPSAAHSDEEERLEHDPHELAASRLRAPILKIFWLQADARFLQFLQRFRPGQLCARSLCLSRRKQGSTAGLSARVQMNFAELRSYLRSVYPWLLTTLVAAGGLYAPEAYIGHCKGYITSFAGPGTWPYVALFALSLYHLALTPVRWRTKDYHDATSSRYKAMRAKHFPPGFPNGWYCVCNATDVADGAVKSIDALGTHLVAFRGEDGIAGVLDAFCPHLGAHLGSGGTVVGNTLRCPFHGWQFEASGKCVEVPYCKGPVPDRAKTKAYVVRELLERIYVWFDAEGRPPQWELRCHEDLARDLAADTYYLAAVRHFEFAQHMCEMAMNSADPFHFKTLHQPFPLPGLKHVLSGDHTITQQYGAGYGPPDMGPHRTQPPEAPPNLHVPLVEADHFASITESTGGLYLFGDKRLRVPFSQVSARSVATGVTFEGPAVVHFHITTPLGNVRHIKTLLPVEPFKLFVESRWYAERRMPRLLAWALASIGAQALLQDNDVWQNKLYKSKPLWVSGDGPFPAFIRWWMQFYSESSGELGRYTLEW
eukprot:6469079-Prymnesium_polylepis.1